MNFNYQNTAHIERHEILTIGQFVEGYIKFLKKVAVTQDYKYQESFINLPFDTELIDHLTQLKEKYVSSDLKYILDIGIGGSNLGTKAVYDALYGHFDLIEPKRFPKIIFLDTTDSSFIDKVGSLLKTIKNKEEILINAVSKSGTTTETIANLEIILAQNRRFKERLIITTEFESPLWNDSKEQGIECLPIPQKVGGRFSVFSAVGMFPLLCAGINTFALMEGAMEARAYCLEYDILENPAVLSAAVLFLSYQNKKIIHDTFFFHSELESLGKWYRQLMAESLGKEGVGITPTVSIGSTDLHSTGQLYVGGPRDKIFTFVWAEDTLCVPVDGKVSTCTINHAILEGVKASFQSHNIPFMETILPTVDEKSIGHFMQFKMFEIMYLARLLNIDAFNQPDVEDYKNRTKEILA
jgi:glucose-6-phosphate isomerase